jgi:hypothetical protein
MTLTGPHVVLRLRFLDVLAPARMCQEGPA